MIISDYLSTCKLFPLMGISQLNTIASELDTMLKLQYGSKTVGSIINDSGTITDPAKITELQQTEIARMVYLLNQHKWNTLLDFVDANLKPWIESQTTKKTEYGKVVENGQSGKDSYAKTDKIAGFDSEDFVNDNSEEHATTYGKTLKDTNSGEDVETTESRAAQAESLVDYALKFWSKNGLIKTILQDTVRTISLPLYESEE